MTFQFENRDGLAQLKEVPDESVRLVLTDPPYLIAHIGPTGKAYEHFDTEESFTMSQLEEFVREWHRVLVPGGTLICWFDSFKLGELRAMCERAKFGGRFRIIRWMKDGGNQVEIKQTYVGWGESALVVSKPPAKEIVFNNKGEGGKAIAHRGLFTARLPRGKDRVHPTQKPVDLFEGLVLLHSNPGDTVLDSFCGSGATPIACALTGRSFIGTELNPEYYAAAQSRLLDLESEEKSQSSMVYVPEFAPKQPLRQAKTVSLTDPGGKPSFAFTENHL
jgi:site-specific DNA-methyltransferase (adenine-specific)